MNTYRLLVRDAVSLDIIARATVRTPNGPRYALEGAAWRAVAGLGVGDSQETAPGDATGYGVLDGRRVVVDALRL